MIGKEIENITLDNIMPNRFQPREIFDEQALNELALSIREHGVIQPITVRKVGEKYEIIAGERRFRASQLAGMKTIPAIVRELDDKEAAKIALLENLQRQDLTPIEEAKTYQTILKLENITQEELANNLGKAQSTVANKIRLLNLDDEVQTALLNNKISERHARSLLNITNKSEQKRLLQKIMIDRMTVKQLDDEIALLNEKAAPESANEIADTLNNSNNLDSIVATEKNIPLHNNNIFDKLRVENQESISKTEAEDFLSHQQNEQESIEAETMNELNITNINSSNENSEKNDSLMSEVEEQPNLNNLPETKNTETLQYDVSNENQEQNQNYNISYENAYDLRFAINNVRQVIQNTKKFGFNIDMEEFDFENIYQIVIKIDKNH